MRRIRRPSRVYFNAGHAAMLLALLVPLSSCDRPQQGDRAGEQEQAASGGKGSAGNEIKQGHLAPLTGKPWLGHADDGTLVKIEFFAAKGSAKALCRASFEGFSGRGRVEKSGFRASEDLATIAWDNGRGSARFSAESGTVDATVVSTLGTHRVTLRQVTPESHPELKTFRRSIGTGEAVTAAHQKVVAVLEAGKRWWKSDPGWDSVATLEEAVEADEADRLALIRPASAKPFKFPAPEPGGQVEFPLRCHLIPGAEIPGERPAVGVFCELHSEAGAQSAWGLVALNPGAAAQSITAQWQSSPDEPAPTGAATLLVYLTGVTSGEGGVVRNFEFDRPVSNLLKLDVEFTDEAEPEPSAE